jgi:Gas vesicle protein
MAGKQQQPHRCPTLSDVIDRVLDKGLVIEYHARVSIGGIDTLMRVDGRCIAASFDTHLRHANHLRSVDAVLRFETQ